MAARDQTPFPASRTLRQLGWIVAGCLALLGHWFGPSPTALLLQVAGAGVFAIATVRPSALRPIVTFLMFTLRLVPWLAGLIKKGNDDSRPPPPPSTRRQIANTSA